MSSTGRGGERSPADFYRTPRWCISAVLSALDLPGGRWLELGAGEGDIIRAVNVRRNDVRWTAVEMREECRPLLEATGAEVIISTVKRWKYLGEPFDVALFNPPFTFAFLFVLLALRIARHVVVLERSPWIGDARERRAHFSTRMPDEYELGRVDFKGDGKSDSIPHSWSHWPPGEKEWFDRERTRGTKVLLPRPPRPLRVAGRPPDEAALARYLNPQLALDDL